MAHMRQHKFDPKNAARVKKRDQLARTAVVEGLGSVCFHCGYSDARALQIDHIRGGGMKELRSAIGRSTYHKNVLASFNRGEDKYQLLCANCNWIKRYQQHEVGHKPYGSRA